MHNPWLTLEGEPLQRYQECLKEFQKMQFDQLQWNKQTLVITQQLLSINPDYYSVWNLRKRMILHWSEKKEFINDSTNKIQELYLNDIQFTTSCLKKHPKSYWVWHHRKWCLQNMPIPVWEQELALLNKMLDLDPRNFHGWDYRRYVIHHSEIQTPLQELEYSTTKIKQNFSNFSAWHYRGQWLMKLSESTSSRAATSKDKTRSSWSKDQLNEIIEKDFELVRKAVYTEPNDQSAWLYQRNLLGNPLNDNERSSFLQPRAIWERELKYIEELVELEPDCKAAILAWIYLSTAESDNTRKAYSSIDLEKLKMKLEKLKSIDPFRSQFYNDYYEKIKSKTED